MGRRLGRIGLDKLQIRLLPEKYGLIMFGDFNEEEMDLQSTFTVCHRLVFGTDSDQSIARHKKAILANKRRAKCPLQMFLITNMVGHLRAYPREQFNPSMLADGRSICRVRQYAEACKETFAAFDLTALDTLASTDNAAFDIDRRMFESEKTAGTWIINFKLWHAGKPYDLLFREQEMSFDPNWLAIEPHYEPYVQAELKQQTTGALREFRHEVLQTRARLKTHKHQAIGNFRARERAVRKAIGSLLAPFRLKPEHLEMEDKAVQDSLWLWHRIGLAIQHVECRRFVDQEKSVYAIVEQPALKDIRGRIPRPVGLDTSF
jgi:hypothetical protein